MHVYSDGAYTVNLIALLFKVSLGKNTVLCLLGSFSPFYLSWFNCVCSLLCCQLCMLENTMPLGAVVSTSDTLIRVPRDMALVLSCPLLPTVISVGLISHPSLL